MLLNVNIEGGLYRLIVYGIRRESCRTAAGSAW